MLKAVDFKQVQQFNNKWEILHSSCKRFIADWNKIRLQSKKDVRILQSSRMDVIHQFSE